MFESLRFEFSLGSDNHSGVHPKIMRALGDANRGGAHAYGLDEVSRLFDREVARVFGAKAEAHLVFNGTAANVLSLSAAMPSYGAVLCAETAHLVQDECAAPEKFLGGKLWTMPSVDGRIVPEQAEAFLSRRGDQHYAQPWVVSLTQPTELGVCYTLAELDRWADFCRARDLYLHLDGARLANAAAHLNVDLATLTRGADVVSFGGTKNGLLGAEAVVIFDDDLKRDVRFRRKQAMQLPSKTRFVAAQMFAYLEGDLWREIAVSVTSAARALARRLPPEVRVVFPVESNALFVELPEAWLKPLRDHAFFYVWDRGRRLARWMISWDFTAADADRLLAAIAQLPR